MPRQPTVRTVLGDVPPDSLGVTDAHDHLFLTSPALPGDELDDTDAAARELDAFHRAGGRALVQWTPHGMGRRLADLARLSRSTGVHVVAATGLHQAQHYDPDRLARLLPRLAERFVADLTATAPSDTPGGTPVGVVKIAGGFHRLDDHALRTVHAAAEAHHATGTPVVVHLELGTAGAAVCDTLARAGVDPSSVVLGHLGRTLDPRAHREAAARGAYLAFDGPSRTHHTTDGGLLDALARLVDAGHGDRLLLGGDTTRRSQRWTDGGTGAPYAVGPLRDRVARELGDDVAHALYVDNPSRAFAATWLVPAGAR